MSERALGVIVASEPVCTTTGDDGMKPTKGAPR